MTNWGVLLMVVYMTLGLRRGGRTAHAHALAAAATTTLLVGVAATHHAL